MNMNDPLNLLISFPIVAAIGFLAGLTFSYAIPLQLALWKDVYSYPKIFRVTSRGRESYAIYYGSDGGMGALAETSNNKATVYVLHPDSQGFAAVLEKHKKKGKAITSAMSRRPLEHQLDFAKIESDGFKGYEYLIDHSLVDFTALRFFTTKGGEKK